MKKKKKRAQLPFRLNLLFFVVFLMFSILIIQLGIVQILNGESYQTEIDRTIQDVTKIPVPRGKVFDRNHNVVVDNKPMYSITYTPQKGVQAKDKLEVAEKLAEFISMDDEKRIDAITPRNKREYWYLKNEEEAVKRLSEEEAADLKNAEQYNLILERITDEEIEGFTDEELEVIAIKRELDKASALTPQIVKNEDVTPEEYAMIAEHLSDLPGINATTDWDRVYPYEDVFNSFLGSITSQEQGILAEREQYYLARGYSRNDRVGRSGLEEQYEDVLRGRKEQIEYTTSKSGTVIDSTVIVPGERGKDLILTVDMDFQAEVDEIVGDELSKIIRAHPYANRHMEDALAVVMNPKTGEILAMSGQHYNRETGEVENAAFKTIYDAHRPGSSVKGATILAGYESGIIVPGQTFNDQRMKIAGTPEKGSYRNLGWVNDYDALRLSSNVYMFYIALRMGGEYNYSYGKAVDFNPAAFQEMRNYFHQFGLGVKTGIDFPFESTGYVGNDLIPGLLMDYAIGQYDTFTTLQLAQYVSTIANDGYRVKPHLVQEIRNPVPYEDTLGAVYRRQETEVLNRIDMDNSEIRRVQEGFRQVFNASGGTARTHWGNNPHQVAGKTGTAENEVFVDGVKYDTENLSLVGYAPYDNPEVAFAIIVPNIGKNSGDQVNHKIGKRIMDAYFDSKENENEDEE